jgi:hypothetical protein
MPEFSELQQRCPNVFADLGDLRERGNRTKYHGISVALEIDLIHLGPGYLCGHEVRIRKHDVNGAAFKILPAA